MGALLGQAVLVATINMGSKSIWHMFIENCSAHNGAVPIPIPNASLMVQKSAELGQKHESGAADPGVWVRRSIEIIWVYIGELAKDYSCILKIMGAWCMLVEYRCSFERL